jgi:hypothetical protein
MKCTLLFFLLIPPVLAQSANAKLGLCVGTNPKVVVYVPTTIGTAGTLVDIPVCVILGPGLKLDMAARGGPLLTTTAATPAPLMMLDTMALPVDTPPTTLSLPFTLTKAPAPATYVIAVFRSSEFGASTVSIVPAQPTITVTLPLYRPFTADDSVQFVYWTVAP